MVFFPRSVKGEAVQLRFDTLPETDTARRASMVPILSCANTSFPTMIAAEKIADAIVAGH